MGCNPYYIFGIICIVVDFRAQHKQSSIIKKNTSLRNTSSTWLIEVLYDRNLPDLKGMQWNWRDNIITEDELIPKGSRVWKEMMLRYLK